MFQLRRLKINRYRNIKPCELRFAPGSNAVLGLNGSGKTTLLKLIADLLSKPFGEVSLPEDAFDVEFDLAFTTGSGSVKLAREHAPFDPIQHLLQRPTGFLIDQQHRSTHSYKLEIDLQFNEEAPIRIWNVNEQLFSSSGNQETRKLHFLPEHINLTVLIFISLRGDLKSKLEKWLKEESLAITCRFDEAWDYFESIAKNHIQSTVANEGDRPVLSTSGMFPLDYYQRFSEEISSNPDLEDIVIGVDQIHALKKFVHLAGLKSAQLKAERIAKYPPSSVAFALFKFGNFRFSFTRRNDSSFPQDHLSYGQKRLLAFLFYLAARPIVVIADELADGMHYSWLQACIEEIGDRQAILAMQNPLVLDHLQFSSVEQVEHSLISCKSEEHDHQNVLAWRNFTHEEAEAFMGAYQSEMPPIRKILHSEGLW